MVKCELKAHASSLNNVAELDICYSVYCTIILLFGKLTIQYTTALMPCSVMKGIYTYTQPKGIKSQ